MTNPAGVNQQLIGVYDQALCRPMAEVLGRLGAKHVMVVNSADGLDEISIADETYVAEFKQGKIAEYTIKPEMFFDHRQSLDGLSVSDAKQSFDIISDALGKQQGDNAVKAADLIAINAGAALYVAGCAADLKQGVAMAQDAIVSGLARAKISDFAAFTRAQADS
jgi:anthranilate phosphoribosyltransferase